MSLRVSEIFQLFKVIMPEKCALTIWELNRNQRFGQDKIEHLSSYAHVVHTTAKRSFHVIERTRTSSKCQKMKNARAKRAKILFSIVKMKYANQWGFCCRRGCEELIFFCKYGNHSSFRSCNCHSPFSPTTFFEIGVYVCSSFVLKI